MANPPGDRGRPTVPARAPRKVPPPHRRRPGASRGAERHGKGADTTQPRPRMKRGAQRWRGRWPRRRRGPRWAPDGETATPRRSKSKKALRGPGRTLSPMPSEQKGAYDGHLAPIRDETLVCMNAFLQWWPLLRLLSGPLRGGASEPPPRRPMPRYAGCHSPIGCKREGKGGDRPSTVHPLELRIIPSPSNTSGATRVRTSLICIPSKSSVP